MANYFLGIETATRMCSVALFEDGQLLNVIEEGGDYSHAEKLAPFVDQILKEAGLTADQLAAVAVSSGPGSYTGLRIGLSLAKGICVAGDLPLISISTLQAMAYSAIKEISDQKALYCPMIDARRMEVYTALYDADLKEIEGVAAKVIDEDSFATELNAQKVYFFGDGAAKCEAVIKSAQASFLTQAHISARSWSNLIKEKFDKEDFEDLAYYEPFYYKDFRAAKPKSML